MTESKLNVSATDIQSAAIADGSKKYHPELISNLKKYQAKTKESWASIAEMIGTSSSILSQWKSKKYTGDVADVNVKVERFLRSQIERSTALKLQLNFVEIGNNKTIKRALTAAMVEGIMCAVIGDTGVSKTTSIIEFSNNNNCIHITANKSYRWPIEYVREIHEHPLVGGSGSGSMRYMVNDIINKLRRKAVVIAVDQCDYLSLTTIDVLRNLNDPIKEGGAGIGIVFVGLPNFLEKLNTIKTPEYRQIRDRFVLIKQLEPFTLAECKLILENNFDDVSGLEEAFYKASERSIRILATLVYNIKKKMLLTGCKLSEKEIEIAQRQIQRQLDDRFDSSIKNQRKSFKRSR